jgi:DNA polymerase-3 subunit epsilon
MKKIVSVDVETSTNGNNSICQIAIAQVVDGIPSVVFESLIQPPGNEYLGFLSGIHGIYPNDTLRAPTFIDVWPTIESYFDGLVIAHNAPFDVSKISGTLRHYGIQPPMFDYFCTYELTGLKLPLACEAYGVELTQHHNAAFDALACLEIYHKHCQGIIPDRSTYNRSSVSLEGNMFSRKKVNSELLRPKQDVPDHYLKGKKVVFTGDLGFLSRNDAAQVAQSLGADVNTTISKRTDVVVMGKGAGPSKLDKLKELQLQGHQIEVLSEERFLKLIQ